MVTATGKNRYANIKGRSQTMSSEENVLSGSGLVKIPDILDRNWVIQHSNQFDLKTTVTLDFSSTSRIDSSGICFLQLLHEDFATAGGKLVLRNVSQELLENLRSSGAHSGTSVAQIDIEKNVAVNFANKVIFLKIEAEKALSILTEMIYWGTIGLFKKRDFRKGVLGEQMYQLGYKALGIVALLSLLIGVVLALQTAIQLATYGAGVFLAPMIGVSMVRELGPLLTAIILAGRTGSATTAEIATMGVGEEIDALRTMGINPIQFILVPKFWAITVTMPTLSLLATATGIIGGFLVAVFYLDLAPTMYWSDLGMFLTMKDVSIGFIKSVVFSWLIIWIGAVYGFRVQGGAEAVGKETTASVVAGIFAIILADAAFSLI
jgi:phospholipid/cholesterol/gamma-HCH transport system permease protein